MSIMDLPTNPSTHLSTHLSTHPSTHLSTNPSTHISTHLPTNPSTHLPTNPSTNPSTHLPTNPSTINFIHLPKDILEHIFIFLLHVDVKIYGGLIKAAVASKRKYNSKKKFYMDCSGREGQVVKNNELFDKGAEKLNKTRVVPNINMVKSIYLFKLSQTCKRMQMRVRTFRRRYFGERVNKESRIASTYMYNYYKYNYHKYITILAKEIISTHVNRTNYTQFTHSVDIAISIDNLRFSMRDLLKLQKRSLEDFSAAVREFVNHIQIGIKLKYSTHGKRLTFSVSNVVTWKLIEAIPLELSLEDKLTEQTYPTNLPNKLTEQTYQINLPNKLTK